VKSDKFAEFQIKFANGASSTASPHFALILTTRCSTYWLPRAHSFRSHVLLTFMKCIFPTKKSISRLCSQLTNLALSDIWWLCQPVQRSIRVLRCTRVETDRDHQLFFPNGLCFDKIISLYFRGPMITTIDIGANRKRDFLHLHKNASKNTKL
jgi:hypothetical protein